MRVIGAISLDTIIARQLAGGVTLFVVKPDLWQSETRARPRAGDLFWIREPFVEFEDKKHPWQNPIAHGDLIDCKRPDWFDKRSPSHVRVRPARAMTQAQSRLTLEVVGVDRFLGRVMALDCKVHLQHVSAVLAQQRAENETIR